MYFQIIQFITHYSRNQASKQLVEYEEMRKLGYSLAEYEILRHKENASEIITIIREHHNTLKILGLTRKQILSVPELKYPDRVLHFLTNLKSSAEKRGIPEDEWLLDAKQQTHNTLTMASQPLNLAEIHLSVETLNFLNCINETPGATTTVNEENLLSEKIWRTIALLCKDTRKLGFDQTKCFSIAIKKEGPALLKIIVEHYSTLEFYGLNNDDILSIANLKNGLKLLELFIQDYTEAIKNPPLSKRSFLEDLNKKYYADLEINLRQNNIELIPVILAILDLIKSLKLNHTEENETIIEFENTSLLEDIQKLKSYGISEALLKSMKNANGAERTLPFITKNYDALTKTCHLTNEELGELTSKRNRRPVLKGLLSKYPSLIQLGLSHKEIIQISQQEGSGLTLDALVRCFNHLSKKMSRENIIALSKRQYSAKVLMFLSENLEQLHPYQDIILKQIAREGKTSLEPLLENLKLQIKAPLSLYIPRYQYPDWTFKIEIMNAQTSQLNEQNLTHAKEEMQTSAPKGSSDTTENQHHLPQKHPSQTNDAKTIGVHNNASCFFPSSQAKAQYNPISLMVLANKMMSSHSTTQHDDNSIAKRPKIT